jgi:hypothetical protein
LVELANDGSRLYEFYKPVSLLSLSMGWIFKKITLIIIWLKNKEDVPYYPLLPRIFVVNLLAQICAKNELAKLGSCDVV